jgi:hypothetical protein
MTGSWLLAYSQGQAPGYAERKGYPPSNIGCPMIRIGPDKGILTLEKQRRVREQ